MDTAGNGKGRTFEAGTKTRRSVIDLRDHRIRLRLALGNVKCFTTLDEYIGGYNT